LLLLQDGAVQFLQAGAIGLLRSQGGSLQGLVGRDGQQLGLQAELALVQHSLPANVGQALLLAPQPLLDVVDTQALCNAGQALTRERLPQVLAPWLHAPGAAVLLVPEAVQSPMPAPPRERWPALAEVAVGARVDGWLLLGACSFGPPGRMFRARDEDGREALLWLAERDADDAFWQREWALRRSPVASLPRVLPSHRPRRHAFLLFEPPPTGMRSLVDWAAAQGPLDGQRLLALLDQAIAAVRALQRRGMQGLWLNPHNLLIGAGAGGRLMLLPEHAALLPGVSRQALPADAIPLAPELRGKLPVDGRADQFALAALVYWLIAGHWPEIARPGGGTASRYVPLANFAAHLPAGWDGVLARALAPQAAARFDALSEFRQALHRSLQHPPLSVRGRRQPWRLALLGMLLVHLALGLWLSVAG
ncbi:protein kinase, partial [Pseudomonas sp. CrR25]|nr:protein kinase [Pseudomonas sp. CrR25]